MAPDCFSRSSGKGTLYRRAFRCLKGWSPSSGHAPSAPLRLFSICTVIAFRPGACSPSPTDSMPSESPVAKSLPSMERHRDHRPSEEHQKWHILTSSLTQAQRNFVFSYHCIIVSGNHTHSAVPGLGCLSVGRGLEREGANEGAGFCLSPITKQFSHC